MRFTLEAVAAAALLFLILSPALQYSSLPEQIPVHFDGAGRPDAWRGKAQIWTLPLTGVLSYALVTALTGYAARKEARKSPPEWAQQRAELTRTLMAGVKAHTLCLFAFILHQSVEVALGRAGGLGPAFFVLLGLLVPMLVFYFVRRAQLN